jgi:hypothetical protein
MKKTLYDILHVTTKASPELIEVAYQARKAILKDATDHESKNELTFVQQAFEILSDQKQRAKYDQDLDSKASNDNSAIYNLNVTVKENNHSGTITFLVLATIAIGCFVAYQYFIKENKKTGASVQATSPQKENPKLPPNVPDDRVAPAAVVSQTAEPVQQQSAVLQPVNVQPQVSVQAYGIKNALAGSWIWNSDKITFALGDRGTYYRNNAVCFEFSYTVKDDVLTETADNLHRCGNGLIASYHISIAKNILTKKHIGTPYESQWEKSSE